jgi:hypothetical protein
MKETSKRSSRVWLWVLLTLGSLVAALAALAVWGAAEFSDTTRTLHDFTTPASARQFVSAHLPTELPVDARVIRLRYDRFTDWRLSATVDLGSEAAATAFLSQVRSAAHTGEAYCGAAPNPSSHDGTVAYFLKKTSACGGVRPTDRAGELHVLCATR